MFVYNRFVEVSALGSFETEIEKINRQIQNKILDENTLKTNISIDVEQNKPKDYNYSNILVDNGTGRISAGLKSLELLSIIRSGTSPSNLFLFDNIIFYGTARDFDDSDENRLIDLVLYNVGMKKIVDALSETTTSEYKNICLKIARLVRSGNYESSIYASYMKKQSPILVKKYLGINK